MAIAQHRSLAWCTLLTAGLLAIACVALLHAPARGSDAPSPLHAAWQGAVPAEDVAPLMAEAVRMTGLPALPDADLPPVWSVSEAALHAAVCHDGDEHCHGLQAVYDTELHRILVLEWGRTRGPEWESFVVHELVHALQYAQHGERIFADCAARRASEQQAYDVQDAYLQRRGALLRVSSQMWWWQCPEDGLRPAARTAPVTAGRAERSR